MGVIKNCITYLAEPLCALVNCSFRMQLFPDKLKIAKVCSIFKGGAQNEFSNYSPISLIPNFPINSTELIVVFCQIIFDNQINMVFV